MGTTNQMIDFCDESDDENSEPRNLRENHRAAAVPTADNRAAKRGLAELPRCADDSSPDTAAEETANPALNPDGCSRSKRARIEASTDRKENDITVKVDSNLRSDADSSSLDGSSSSTTPLMVLLTSSDPTDEQVVVTSNLLDILVTPRLLFTRRPVRLCHSPTLLHVQQRDSWSCGFRNLQMLLSALLPLLPSSHSYFADRPRESMEAMDVPSLKQLQHCLEQAWALGMDPKGRRHYGGRIADTQAQIGAVEVATALNACGLDATVVQFISVPESRTQLGQFCAAYMDTQNCDGRSSRERAAGLLRDLINSPAHSCSTPQSESSSHRAEDVGPSLPLYLQYQGHSVTIVGVEYDDHRMNPTVSNLLVFDPRQRGENLHSALQRGDLAPLRRSVARLHCQDTQVVLCTPSEIRSKGMSVVTANEQAVSRHRRR